MMIQHGGPAAPLLGQLEVADKIGTGAAPGTVFKEHIGDLELDLFLTF